MASEVDICNMALAHIGDRANVASINPPERTPQGLYCATFYPTARDVALESHAWGFATRRADLALSAKTPPPQWQFAYVLPACIRALAVYSSDDTGAACVDDSRQQADGDGTPQPFAVESDDDGTLVLYTNQDSAVLKYTARVTDTTKFSPLFINALSYLLASYLAGPIIKGDEGTSKANGAYQAWMYQKGLAATSDAGQQHRTQRTSRRQGAWER